MDYALCISPWFHNTLIMNNFPCLTQQILNNWMQNIFVLLVDYKSLRSVSEIVRFMQKNTAPLIDFHVFVGPSLPLQYGGDVDVRGSGKDGTCIYFLYTYRWIQSLASTSQHSQINSINYIINYRNVQTVCLLFKAYKYLNEWTCISRLTGSTCTSNMSKYRHFIILHLLNIVYTCYVYMYCGV